MSQEHPFAPFVRVLGKGPRLSRPLTQAEAREAMGHIMAGRVEPVQLGAFLCLLRVKTETPEEVAGLAEGIRDHLVRPAACPAVDLDWSSYAGKARQLPYYLLAALALAQSGRRIFMHGAEDHTEGRVYTSASLAALGLAPAATMEDAARRLERDNFAYVTLPTLSPRLGEIMALKKLLGLRSPIHTVARVVNPLDATCSLSSISHPPYGPVQQEAARLVGHARMAVFKGEGGEVERRPAKPVDVLSLVDGQPLTEQWPAMQDGVREKDEDMELARLLPLWRGEAEEPWAEAAITGTMAIALKALGRAATIEQAEDMARRLWAERDRTHLPGC